MPLLVVDHNAATLFESLHGTDLFGGLFGHFPIEIFAGFIVEIDVRRLFECRGVVGFDEELYGLFAVLHASGGVDAGADFENDVVHRQFPVGQTANFHDGLESDGGVGIESPQTVVGQDAVFAHDGHDVGGDGHDTKVEQLVETVELDAVVGGKGLHEFESHAATRQMRVGIVIVAALGVENGHGRRQHFVGHVVVADDEIDAALLGVGNFVDRFDAAVQDDDESHPGFGGIVDAALRHPVTLIVAVGDVVVDVVVVVTDEPVDQGHRSDAVDVIVAVDHDALLAKDGLVEAFDGDLHVVHEERVVQIGELRPEESACFGSGVDATLAKHASEDRMHA